MFFPCKLYAVEARSLAVVTRTFKVIRKGVLAPLWLSLLRRYNPPYKLCVTSLKSGSSA
jgi:hypothetical protein